MDNVTIRLSPRELDFIIQVLGSLSMLNTHQAGMVHLIPKMQDQANDKQLQKECEPHFSG